MIRSNDRRRSTALAILALAAGSVTAAQAQASGDSEMEVVEVVTKRLPTLVSQDDYFAPLAEDLKPTLDAELRNNLAVSAMSGYQLLAAELELSNGARVAADDSDRADVSDAESGPAKGT